MDFYESIFSILPLLVIVFFFIRLAAAAKKRGRTKPLNTIEAVEKNEQKEVNPAIELPKSESVEQRNESRVSAPAALGSLDKINYRNLHPEEKPQAEVSGDRLKDLPELKKALIWSEILGKPKGLD